MNLLQFYAFICQSQKFCIYLLCLKLISIDRVFCFYSYIFHMRYVVRESGKLCGLCGLVGGVDGVGAWVRGWRGSKIWVGHMGCVGHKNGVGGVGSSFSVGSVGP